MAGHQAAVKALVCISSACAFVAACDSDGDQTPEGASDAAVSEWREPPMCFVATTPIATPDGSTPIEALRPGDRVLGYDTDAHVVVSSTVLATLGRSSDAIRALRLDDGRVLRVTPEHPFYLPVADRYVPLDDLPTDVRLLSLVFGADGPVTTSAIGLDAAPLHVSGPAPVFNITVDGPHNYFAAGVLVHNKLPCEGDCTCTNTCSDEPLDCAPVRFVLERPANHDAGTPCRWDVPRPDGEEPVKPALVTLGIAPGLSDASVSDVPYSENGSCGALAWHFDDPVEPGAIIGCPDLCTLLEADPSVTLTAMLGCHRGASLG